LDPTPRAENFRFPENALTVKSFFPTEIYRKFGWGLTVSLTVNLYEEKIFYRQRVFRILAFGGQSLPGRKFGFSENALTVKKKITSQVYGKLGWE
jgi:hypothetical protein